HRRQPCQRTGTARRRRPPGPLTRRSGACRGPVPAPVTGTGPGGSNAGPAGGTEARAALAEAPGLGDDAPAPARRAPAHARTQPAEPYPLAGRGGAPDLPFA